MGFSPEQTARLQKAIDALPECFFAEDLEDTAKRLAGSLTLDPTWMNEALQSALSGLVLTGKTLFDEGGDGANAAHGGIAGLYCKGSDGYTDFLRAYAGAYRAWDDIMQAKAKEGNWAGDLIKATKSFFKDAGDGIGKLGSGALLDLFKGLWPVIALLGAIIVGVVIIAVVTKGKISVR